MRVEKVLGCPKKDSPFVFYGRVGARIASPLRGRPNLNKKHPIEGCAVGAEGLEPPNLTDVNRVI